MAVVPAQDRLGAAVQDMLNLAATGLHEAGETFVAYISPDLPSLDFLGQGPRPCSAAMLAAYVSNVGREPTTPTGQLPSEMAHKYAWLNLAQVTLTYARCIRGMTATGAPPPASAQTDDALTVIRGGWAIYNALNWGIAHGLVLPGCRQFRMGQLVPLSGGGAAGYTITVGFQIDGYDEFVEQPAPPGERHFVGVSDTSPAH